VQEQNNVVFPPDVHHPLFGTSSNITLEIDSRKLVIDWCRWMKKQWQSAR
jgi:hypothetical protein